MTQTRSLFFLSLVSILATGCGQSVFKNVDFSLSQNLETVKVQLNFDSSIQSDLGGTFEVKNGDLDFGTFEVEPSDANTPFNVGFRVNLDILNEQKFLEFEATNKLPSGQALPNLINRPLYQVKLKNEINANFDIYLFADPPATPPSRPQGGEWVGMALTLKFFNAQTFPSGLSLYQNFVKSKNGNFSAAACIFGPKLDQQNQIVQYGGIGFFVNVKNLIDDSKTTNLLVGASTGATVFTFDGPLAPMYRNDNRMLNTLAKSVQQAFQRQPQYQTIGSASVDAAAKRVLYSTVSTTDLNTLNKEMIVR